MSIVLGALLGIVLMVALDLAWWWHHERHRHEPVSGEQRRMLLAARCQHCGGIHATACPRVHRLVFGPDGEMVTEVEFAPWSSPVPWADWKRGVVWPDDLFEFEEAE